MAGLGLTIRTGFRVKGLGFRVLEKSTCRCFDHVTTVTQCWLREKAVESFAPWAMKLRMHRPREKGNSKASSCTFTVLQTFASVFGQCKPAQAFKVAAS